MLDSQGAEPPRASGGSTLATTDMVVASAASMPHNRGPQIMYETNDVSNNDSSDKEEPVVTKSRTKRNMLTLQTRTVLMLTSVSREKLSAAARNARRIWQEHVSVMRKTMDVILSKT